MDLNQPVTSLDQVRKNTTPPSETKTREQQIIGFVSNVVLLAILISIGAGIVIGIIITLIAYAQWIL